jgi:hypothetical protein
MLAHCPAAPQEAKLHAGHDMLQQCVSPDTPSVKQALLRQTQNHDAPPSRWILTDIHNSCTGPPAGFTLHLKSIPPGKHTPG